MHVVTIDTETDTYNEGNPFDERNKLCAIGWKENDATTRTTQETPAIVQRVINSADLVVGFNFKFDYHWLNKAEYNLTGKRIWDCQTAAYILSHQQSIFPSLNDCCLQYGLAPKLDIIKRDYWDRGITTSDIPWDVVSPYLAHDVDQTYAVFVQQWNEATEAQRALILLDGDDIHVLREMEHTGLLYNAELCAARAEEIDKQIEQLQKKLASFYPHVPINFGSGDHLSAFLYGGTIEQVVKVHDGFYKTGAKKGQPKLRNEVVTHTLPGLYKPLPGSELKKGGVYATNEPTLRSLKGNRKVVDLLLELAKLEKQNNTYYRGLPKRNAEMNWPVGVLHSNFNMTQTATGRRSSSKPNQQNLATDLLDIFISRYAD